MPRRDMELVDAMRNLRQAHPGTKFKVAEHGWMGKVVMVHRFHEWHVLTTAHEVKLLWKIPQEEAKLVLLHDDNGVQLTSAKKENDDNGAE